MTVLTPLLSFHLAVSQERYGATMSSKNRSRNAFLYAGFQAAGAVISIHTID